MSGDTDNSSNPYDVFVRMERLNENLKLLNYEREYCRSRHQKPFPKHYYALQTNPGEQFNNFTSLAAWLIGKANGKIDPPQEYDDPNATIATILDAVRQLGHAIEFAPSKLKSGCGDHCVDVLLMLAESALKIQGHKFKSPNYPKELKDEIDVDEPEPSTETMDEELSEWQGNANGRLAKKDHEKEYDTVDSDKDDGPDLEALQHRGSHVERSPLDEFKDPHENATNSVTSSPDPRYPYPNGVLESTTDPTDWQLEVERVLPQLRLRIRNDMKDWRFHLEEMRKHQGEIDEAHEDVKTLLARLQGELNRALEKINSREKYINGQAEPLLAQYKYVQDILSDLTSKYRQASGGITERSRILSELNDELEQVKNEMDERGSSMTDGSPVVRIKQAIQRLRAELVGMDIRTGVLEHMLLRAQLRQREDRQRPLFANADAKESDNPAFVY